MRRLVFLVLMTTGLGGVAASVTTGEAVPPDPRPAPPRTLDAALVRIAELEARVAELEGRLAAAGAEAARLEAAAGVVPRDARAAAAAGRFTAHHDEAADRTEVTGPVLPVESNRGLSNARFLIAAAFTHPGPPGAGPVGAVDPLDLYVATRRHTNNRLRGTTHAELRIDGVTTARLPRAEYVEEARHAPPAGAGRARRGVVTWDERLRFTLDRTTAVRLAHAGHARLHLDGLELRLTADHLAAVKAVLLRSSGDRAK